jgi:hypothetical protein
MGDLAAPANAKGVTSDAGLSGKGNNQSSLNNPGTTLIGYVIFIKVPGVPGLEEERDGDTLHTTFFWNSWPPKTCVALLVRLRCGVMGR